MKSSKTFPACECHTHPRTTENKQWFIHLLLPNLEHSSHTAKQVPAWPEGREGVEAVSCITQISFPPTLQQNISRNVPNGAGDYSAACSRLGQTSFWVGQSDTHKSKGGLIQQQHTSALPAVSSDEWGKANISSFVTHLNVAQTQESQESHLLIFANSLVVFHNHINAGGRVQRCSLQIKLQHLRQDRTPDIRGVQRGPMSSEHSLLAIRSRISMFEQASVQLWED